MESNKSIYAIIGVILFAAALSLGMVVQSGLTPVKTIETIKEVPVVQEKLKEVPVEKIVYQNITTSAADKFTNAQNEFQAEVDEKSEYQICNGQRYDFDQIVFKDVKQYSVEKDSSSRNHPKEVVSFSQELKYVDKDTSEKCYKTFDVEVTFEVGEDAIVEIA